MVSAVISRFFLISILVLFCGISLAQNDTSVNMEVLNDPLFYERIDSSLMQDSLDSVRRDTLVPAKFTGYDKTTYRNSKANLRKTLLASKNPPVRKNLGNWIVFVWAVFIASMIIFFKSNYALQYRLLNKSWFSDISFNEFFSTQTFVFKNSKLLSWLIISMVISMGVFIILKTTNIQEILSEYIFSSLNVRVRIQDTGLVLLISLGVILILMANQWLKTVFAYSFSQPSLSHDYAIIFRIQAYVAALFLMPFLLFIYYNGAWDVRLAGIISLVGYILVVYASSLFKFIFSGRFLQNQSNFILILYLCAFEILPLLVLIIFLKRSLVI